MLRAGYSAGHGNWSTVPLRRMRAHLWGWSPAKGLEVARTCLCGDQALRFWFAALAPLGALLPAFPAATRLSPGAAMLPFWHLHDDRVCKYTPPPSDTPPGLSAGVHCRRQSRTIEGVWPSVTPCNPCINLGRATSSCYARKKMSSKRERTLSILITVVSLPVRTAPGLKGERAADPPRTRGSTGRPGRAGQEREHDQPQKPSHHAPLPSLASFFPKGAHGHAFLLDICLRVDLLCYQVCLGSALIKIRCPCEGNLERFSFECEWQ
uniref:uncharacterized protein LOC118538792 n=1 Tax=Halichoerus grypus TaxID=9711 RepID=UPI00165A0221|nr:uncharacterized protein LOC118538792 [Halichoerus grypus]